MILTATIVLAALSGILASMATRAILAAVEG